MRPFVNFKSVFVSSRIQDDFFFQFLANMEKEKKSLQRKSWGCKEIRVPAKSPLTLFELMKTSLYVSHPRGERLITCLPHIDPASGSLQYPWWSWHFPWPRWSRFLWYRTNRGYRCRSGSTPALLRIPASHQCWQCVNPIREQGD